MESDSSTPKETVADELYRQKVLDGKFEDIPMVEREVELDVPEDVAEFCRERAAAARDRSEDVASLDDFLMDHVNLSITFTVDGDPIGAASDEGPRE